MSLLSQLLIDVIEMQFFHSSACTAYQKLKAMRVFGTGAGDVGIERLDAMYQALLDEEFQRTVDSWRARRGMFRRETVK